MKAILSIKPEFITKMSSGKKKFEFRRRIFKQDVHTVIVYATSPVKAIIGEFTIDEILFHELDELWEITKSYSGISKSFFYEYFKNREKGFAIKIKNFINYDSYLSLNEFGLVYPPQSFIYVS